MTASRKWLFGGIAAAILFFLLGFFLIVNPARSDAAALNEQAIALEQSNVKSAARLEQLKQQSAEVPAKLEEIESVKRKMPDEIKQPELIRSIEQEAASAGVDLTTIQPATPTSIEGTGTQIIVLPMNISAVGRYANIKTFVDNLERLERAFLIKNVEVTGSEGDAGNFTLTLTGDFFSLPAEAIPDTGSGQSAPQATPAPTSPPTSATAAAKAPKQSATAKAKDDTKKSTNSASGKDGKSKSSKAKDGEKQSKGKQSGGKDGKSKDNKKQSN